MKDLNHIYKRNIELIEKMIKEYKLSRTLEQLLNNFERVYVHHDPKTQRIRLLGIEKQFDQVESYVNENGTRIYAAEKIPTKRIQLYVLKKKYYEDMEDSEKNELMTELNFFVALFKQIKNIRSIEKIEDTEISFYENWKEL